MSHETKERNRMRLLFAAMLVCAACDSKSEPAIDRDGSGSATSSGGGSTGGQGGGGEEGGDGCGGKAEETRLPNVRPGEDVVVFCKECNHGCELEGEPCDSYGSQCDFFGEPGVCIACCNGERGELHCSDID